MRVPNGATLASGASDEISGRPDTEGRRAGLQEFFRFNPVCFGDLGLSVYRAKVSAARPLLGSDGPRSEEVPEEHRDDEFQQ